jgi:hypothetical protein
MPWYKHEVAEKSDNQFKEKSEQKLEGSLNVAPDSNYMAGQVYKLVGLGSVFDATYKFKKCVHRIANGLYEVTADVVLKGSSGGGGSSGDAASPSSNRATAPTKSGEEATVSINKATGVVS